MAPPPPQLNKRLKYNTITPVWAYPRMPSARERRGPDKAPGTAGPQATAPGVS